MKAQKITPALIKKLTVCKDGDFHLLKFTPAFFYLLNFHPANRQTDIQKYKKHQANLYASREEIGQTNTPTLSLEESALWIVDGQNRIKAWKDEKKAIFCTLSTGDFSRTMILSNSNNEKLTTNEYIDHYAKKGKNTSHYQILQDMLVEHGTQISPALLLGICSGKPRLQAKKDVLAGTYTNANLLTVKKYIDQIYAMQKAGLKIGIRQSEAIYNLILEKKELYNSSLIIKRFKTSKNRDVINLMADVKEILNLLRDIHDNTEVTVKINKKLVNS